ncbi:MAG: peptidylprolyl isomerase [Alphaproteobacteria bacterium]|nr:peptidylprolyl isomerase [Alphaproteobacteria bacterium]MBO4643527.1 peptidylprolyl isomerase [Alphaproteobacteria bacterium]
MLNKMIAVALVALCFASPAQAAKAKAKKAETASDLVIATVNGNKITLSEIESVHKANPQLGGLPLESIYEPLLDNMIDLNVVSSAAQAAKVQDSPEFKKAVKSFEKQLMARFYLEEQAKKGQTKEKLMALYEQFKKDNPPQEEMSAAHILLKTEKEAENVIKQLEKGADFAELANKLSENKGLEDGELGYFSRELMVPEFSEAAFAMKEGEISKKPVKTKFGYHVIKAGPRRLAEVPKYEDIEKELMQSQAAQTIDQTVKDLRKKAKIVKTPVKFDANGKVTAK